VAVFSCRSHSMRLDSAALFTDELSRCPVDQYDTVTTMATMALLNKTRRSVVMLAGI
jgi:hypothetical protein